MEIQDFVLWDKLKARRAPLSFDLGITARRNNDCRHCYVAVGGVMRLSNPALLELVRGVAEHGVPLRTVVYGSSMTPFVRDGDVVVIVPTAGSGPRVGDVVACELPGGRRMVVHRVVERRGDGWLIRGDNCHEPDGVVTTDAIVGRVVQVERGGRRVHLGFGSQGPWVAVASRCGAMAGTRAAWRSLRAARVRALISLVMRMLLRGASLSRNGLSEHDRI